MILCDANVLVALVDPRDQLRPIAAEDLERLAGEDLLVTLPVLAEAIFLLPHPMQRERLAHILDGQAIAPVGGADTYDIRGKVFEWLQQYAEHEPDWADAHLAVLCGRDRHCRVWTYDAEFRTIWRRPDGSRIPIVGKDLRH